MEPIELLSNQLKQYQDQNQKEHETLMKKIDELLSEVHALHRENVTRDKKVQEIENRQMEIQSNVQDIQKDVQQIKNHHMNRSYLWKWVLGALGTLGVLGGIISVAWKFGLF